MSTTAPNSTPTGAPRPLAVDCCRKVYTVTFECWNDFSATDGGDLADRLVDSRCAVAPWLLRFAKHCARRAWGGGGSVAYLGMEGPEYSTVLVDPAGDPVIAIDLARVRHHTAVSASALPMLVLHEIGHLVLHRATRDARESPWTFTTEQEQEAWFFASCIWGLVLSGMTRSAMALHHPLEPLAPTR